MPALLTHWAPFSDPSPPLPQAYDRMKAQGCKADAIVYNAIIDALWETGVVWVQRRALKLFRCGPRGGRGAAHVFPGQMSSGWG